MASTSQSALEYLMNARVHLVGQLRNLSVILENLQGVLTYEEVSKIKAEKDDYDRTIATLDSVVRKGEAACYQLLRIIDLTRGGTLEGGAPFLKDSQEDSPGNKRFDLHHWISCFPFTEDAEMAPYYIQVLGPRWCHRYQAKLKSKAEKLSKDFWRASQNLFEENKKPNLSYSPLALEIQGDVFPPKIKMCRPKRLRTHVTTQKPAISPSDLLKTDKNVLLVGKPGAGKTALSHEMLRLWIETDIKEIDYMFYFDMREMADAPTTLTLEDLLFSLYSKPGEGREEILQDIERNPDNVTVILDGVTDLSSPVVQKLVEKDAKIIITCRPEDEEDIRLPNRLRVEVKGFSEGAIKTYLSKALGDDHQEVLSNVELVTLSHVPMYALMMAAGVSSDFSLQPKTVTEIYINIVRFNLQMNSNRTRMKNLSQFIGNKRDEIMSLAEAAFYATQSKTVKLEGLSLEDGCILSFLKSLDVKVAPTETITVHAFLHYTMQEFFAALWLLKDPEKIREVFQKSLTDEMKHMKHLIPFMCRLLNDRNPRLMSCLLPAVELKRTSDWFLKEMIDTFCSEPKVDRLFQYRCLYESQSVGACISFLNKLDFHLDLSGENLDPYSCQAVAFIVTQSKKGKTSLNLQDVTVSDQGVRRLFGCLHNVQWYELMGLFRLT
uniref:NACHT domain-containing protein n=1 Tax=Cyprinodon variegatus TaxID=28743 RepID=A0A3Q2DPQ3_CYPVA